MRAAPEEAGPPTSAAEECFVIQNRGLSDVVRLVMLAGDPLVPYEERGGVATLELLPSFWSPDEQLEVVHFFTRLMRDRWRRQQEIDAFVQRAMLELVRG